MYSRRAALRESAGTPYHTLYFIVSLSLFAYLIEWPFRFQINEHDMVVSLPSSLTGVVRRKEVSDYFHHRAKTGASGGGGRGGGGRGRYFDESGSNAGDKPLTDLFQEGQVG